MIRNTDEQSTRQSSILKGTPYESWTGLISNGITQAIAGLSGMVGEEISTTFLAPRTMPAASAYQLVGGPESTLIAIHLGVTGEAAGHILILFQPETAFDLVRLLLELDDQSEVDLDDLSVSTIGELGNVMGAQFLSALGDSTGVRLMPTPPTVMYDMAGAMLDAAVSDVMGESDDIVVVESRFGTLNRQIRGVFLVLPDQELKDVLLSAWAQR